MESLINRAIYHPHVALPMLYLTDLMCDLDCSLAVATLVMASTFCLSPVADTQNPPPPQQTPRPLHQCLNQAESGPAVAVASQSSNRSRCSLISMPARSVQLAPVAHAPKSPCVPLNGGRIIVT
jgi:hypothetical protein